MIMMTASHSGLYEQSKPLGSVEDEECGVWSVENGSVENVECEKRGVWKMSSVENGEGKKKNFRYRQTP